MKDNTSVQENIGTPVTEDTFIWTTTVKPASASQTVNGLFLYHISIDCTTPIDTLTAITANAPFNTQITSSGPGGGDQWTVFYLDSNNVMWVYPDFQVNNPGPDASDTLTITIDTNAKSASFEFTANPNNNFTLSGFVKFQSLSGSCGTN